MFVLISVLLVSVTVSGCSLAKFTSNVNRQELYAATQIVIAMHVCASLKKVLQKLAF